MKLRDKRFWKFEAMMCSVALAFLFLNPLICTPGVGLELYSQAPILILFPLIAYLTGGVIIWITMKQRTTWWKLAIRLFLVCNFLHLVFICFWVNNIKDGMTGLMFLFGAVWNCIFSAIPIGIGCYVVKCMSKKHKQE